jgi:hypothetical protein
MRFKETELLGYDSDLNYSHINVFIGDENGYSYLVGLFTSMYLKEYMLKNFIDDIIINDSDPVIIRQNLSPREISEIITKYFKLKYGAKPKHLHFLASYNYFPTSNKIKGVFE